MPLHPGAGLTLLAAFLVAVLTLRLAPEERRAIFTAFAALLGCFALLVLGGLLLQVDLDFAAGYIRGTALFAEGLCLIYLAFLCVFRGLLPGVRVHTPHIVQDVVIAVGWVVWAVIWLRVNRVDLTSIVATSAVVTAVVAFSLQDTLGNILGGIAIQLDQSIQVGDWLVVDDVVGRVSEIRWRQTSLETRTWETVVIPNSALVKNRFRVLGRRKGAACQFRRTVKFSVDYEFTPTQVINAVEKGVQSSQIPKVSHDPAPHCLFLDFGDSSAIYGVRYWLTEFTSDEPVDSDVRESIFFALQRAGIPLSTPSQSVFVTHDSAERRLEQEERTLRERIQALGQIELFGSLQPAEVKHLAERLDYTPFERGALMTRQGSDSDCLYLMVEGQADVLIDAPDGGMAQVAEVGPGSFFGEMALMTGEPRSATVIARSKVEAFRLDKSAFEEVLRARPAIAEEVCQVLTRRRSELDHTREALDSEAEARRLAKAHGDLLARIQKFFALN